MRKLTITLMFLIYVSPFYAQKDTSGTLVFKVRNGKNAYSVFPSDSTLFAEKDNVIKIKVRGKRPYKVYFEGGVMTGSDSIFTIRADSAVSGLLTIKETHKNESKIAFTKPYKIFHIPLPYVMVSGVKADSVIDKQQLINVDKVMAYSGYYKMFLKVLSFDMIYANAGVFDTLSAETSHFTPEMKKHLYGLKSGSILYFENVKCVMRDGSARKLASIQIFINETDKYKVGYRIPK